MDDLIRASTAWAVVVPESVAYPRIAGAILIVAGLKMGVHHQLPGGVSNASSPRAGGWSALDRHGSSPRDEEPLGAADEAAPGDRDAS
ncbi:MAG: hypothetical protein JWN96_3829 [Mycobacterium sp.]|jgi:hypothetical protein|nr:hypothetical protein [Mycobacterium sp.]